VYEILENCFALAFVYNHRQYREIPDIVALSVVTSFLDAALNTFRAMTQITADKDEGAKSIPNFTYEWTISEAIKKGTSIYLHYGFVVLG
jgi:hypothetical protein